jgi:predicted metal-dependent enzyme (double-stranded beta helix superfamily)
MLTGGAAVFETDQFVADCRLALGHDRSSSSICEVVARAVSTPAALIKALGEPRRAQIQTLYRSPELTVLNVIWAPKMTLFPHNHQMWAVIGIYSGREDNIFWRRLPGNEGKVEAVGAKSLSDKETVPLGRDIIHSVTNPIGRLTGAIHVYGGDFFNAHRSEWDPEFLVERPCDPQRLLSIFEEENARFLTPVMDQGPK